MILKDAFRFLIPLIVSAALAFLLGLHLAAFLVMCMAAFVAFFFRNPKRRIPSDPDVIVSPADGRVVQIERVGKATKISIFLSIFDVHVNRSPIAGRIESVDYKRGRFRPAFNHAASVGNERNIVMIAQGDVRLVLTQIAGIVARRIVFWPKIGDAVEKGEVIGLIRFGSRVDLLLPAGTEATVERGARVRGGSSPIARLQRVEGGAL
jgi:phosphatidylserine decarboxylase